MVYFNRDNYVMKMKSKKPSFSGLDLSMGLGDDDIIQDDLLWNYCALTSRLPYLWEDEDVPMRAKPMRFSDLSERESDLEKEVAHLTVRDMMRYDPRDFLTAIQDSPVSHLYACKFFGSEDTFRTVVASRVYTWMETQGMELTEDELAVVTMVSWDV